MVNNWQCFKRSWSQVVYKKTWWCLLILSAGAEVSVFVLPLFFFNSGVLWSEKKNSPFPSPLSWPIWYSPDGVPSYHPHSPFSPPSVPLSFPLTEPSDLLQRPLLSMGATLTEARTGLYKGCIQDHNLPEHTPCEVGQQTKDQGRL